MSDEMVTDEMAATWRERLLFRARMAPSVGDMFLLALLADRKRMLGLLEKVAEMDLCYCDYCDDVDRELKGKALDILKEAGRHA